MVAPFIFLLTVPFILLICVSQLVSGSISPRTLAVLGVLSAINAALRPLGAGLAGVETVFFLLILAGRVFGPAFGFLLGLLSIFASALLTAGVGPWLPYQMLACAWIGMGAGLLPSRVRGAPEIVMLAVYGAITAFLYGLMMNLTAWPIFTQGTDLGYNPGASLPDNLSNYLMFSLISSTLTWDLGRAITTVVLIALTGRAILAVLRRAYTRVNVHASEGSLINASN